VRVTMGLTRGAVGELTCRGPRRTTAVSCSSVRPRPNQWVSPTVTPINPTTRVRAANRTGAAILFLSSVVHCIVMVHNITNMMTLCIILLFYSVFVARDDSGVNSCSTAPYIILLYISIGTLQPPYTASTRDTSVDKSIPGEGVQVVCPSLLYYHLFIIVITIVKRNCACNSTIIYFSSGMTFGYRFGSRTTAKCRQILDSFETAAGRTVCDDSEKSIPC